MELQFITTAEEVICSIRISDAYFPSVGDTLDLYDDSGNCNYLRITGRKFRYNQDQKLYQITYYCEDM